MAEPQEENSPAPKRRLESAAIALTAFCTFAGATGLALYYHYRQEAKNSTSTNLTGFDIKPQSQASAGTVSYVPSAAPQPNNGSMSMIRGRIEPSSNFAATTPDQKAANSLTAACRAHENEVRDLAIAYTRRYPVIAQYGRDWMRYPDLKKLNDDYMRNHDPIAFIKGVTVSRNFRVLVGKYARQPEIQSFAKDLVTRAPQDLLAAAAAYLSDNQNMAAMANTILSALGLPPGLVNFAGGTPQINTGAMLQSILSNPPSPDQQGGTPTLSPPP